MVSEPLLWPFLSSLVFISVTFFLSLNASAITTAAATSCRWTSDVIQPSSLGSGPAAVVVKEFHTAQTTALYITAANIAPISFLKVPLRSSSTDLHIRGYLAAIGDRTRPHAPLKDSAAPPRTSTRCHAPGLVCWRHHLCHVSPSCVSIHWSADVISTSSSVVDRWPPVDHWLWQLTFVVDRWPSVDRWHWLVVDRWLWSLTFPRVDFFCPGSPYPVFRVDFIFAVCFCILCL